MKVRSKLEIAGVYTGITLVVGVASIISPVVSAIALPILGVRSLRKWVKHRELYNRTLTNQTREKYGRIPGQDYTRWDGRAVVQTNATPTESERMHELMGMHMHGSNDPYFMDRKTLDVADAFPLPEDKEWLKKEYTCREAKASLDSDLRMARAFAKALIPIGGVLWVLFTETAPGGGSQLGCPVCQMGSSEESHWEWPIAILYHQNKA